MSELVLLCIKILCVRIMDVSMATTRTVMTIKGKKIGAALIGFVEALIWFLVVKEAMTTDIKSIWIALSYATGFSLGTFIGSIISNKFIKGTVGFQIILSDENKEIINILREKGYAVSVIDVRGVDDKNKYMLFMEVDNKNKNNLIKTIKELDDKAFIVVSESKSVINGYFTK